MRGRFDDGTVLDSETFAVTEEERHELAKRLIADLRRRLLDLSTRNRLLSFSFGARARQVRVVDVLPDALYQRLVDGKTFVFRALPKTDLVPEDEQSPEFELALEEALTERKYYADQLHLFDDPDAPRQLKLKLERRVRDRVRDELGMPPFESHETMTVDEWARKNGINPSFELPRGPEDLGSASTRESELQLLLFPKEMERKLRGIREGARLALSEMGINILFMAFGFLEWTESESSGRVHLAPLLLHPLQMDQKLVRQVYRYYVRSTGDDTEINYTLQERLRQDFGIELPLFEDDDTPETYFEKVEQAITEFKHWRVRRFVAVSLFPFGRIAMYHDLDPERWPESAALHRHPILLDLLTGSEPPESLFAEEYDVDSPEIARKVPTLITEADSSQFSAIVDVMSGRNVVIKGPPGTGKSQTITNIIASALHEGKKVLFVAEKMAALEVVKKRLDDAGLGDFVLELHSTKARRKDVLASLARRMERMDESTGEHAEELREEFQQIVHGLREYADELNRPFGALGMTVHEILWAYIRHRSDADRLELPAQLSGVVLQNVSRLTKAGLNERRAALQSVEALAAALEEKFGSIYHHPWFGTDLAPLTPLQQEDLLQKLHGWAQALDDVRAGLQRLRELGIEVGSLGKATRLVQAIDLLPDDLPTGVVDIARRLGDAEGREAVAALLRDLETWRRAMSEIAELQGRTVGTGANYQENLSELEYKIEAPEVGETLGLWSELENAVPAEVATFRDLSELSARLAKADAGLDKLIQRTGRILSKADITIPLTLESLSLLGDALVLAQNTPDYVLGLRTSALVDETAEQKVNDAIDRAQRLREKESSLQEVFVLRDDDDVQLLRNAAGVLRSTTGWFARWFSKEFREAERVWRSRRVTPEKADVTTMARQLDELASFYDTRRRFEDDSSLRELLGQGFQGVHTDFSRYHAVVSFAGEVRRITEKRGETGQVLRRLLLHGDVEILSAFAVDPGAGLEIKTLVEQLRRFAAEFGLGNAGYLDLYQFREKVRKLQDMIYVILDAQDAWGLREELGKEDLERLAESVRRRDESNRGIVTNVRAAELLQTHFRGEETDVEVLRSALTTAETLWPDFAPAVVSSVLDAAREHGIVRLKTVRNEVAVLLDNEREARGTLESIIEFVWSEFLGQKDPDSASIERLRTKVEQLVEHHAELPGWIDFRRAWQEVRNLGVEDIPKTFSNQRRQYKHLDKALDLVVFQSLVRELYEENGALKWLSGEKQERLRSRLRAADKELLTGQRRELVDLLLDADPPRGISSGPKRTWTDLALLRNEVSKQKRHLPLRELFWRAKRAILALKPCWMMSPASVAQYIAPGTVEFDLVVIDEASQMRPEEALGAIARGKQLVVVGDPEQLPPTDFFRRFDYQDVDGDEDEEEFVDSESILDLALRTFHPVRQLRWHYRSRHESLIAFSNKEFYDSSLVVFPSAHRDDRDLGVRYVHVQGTYIRNKRINPVEAQRVAEAAIEFMKKYPKRSLGIVCVNKEQTELLQEEISMRMAHTPEAEKYRVQWEATLEPFFIKNLENVQGDERDVIFVSTVYGPDQETGQVAQRFGPINTQTGHRRLNVLFTRAKEQVVVFSSLKPEDIQPTERSHRGVYVLRGYLEFARSGFQALGKVTGREPDSDFEIFVAERLRTHGYEVVPQVGVDGYFVDIGVLDPDNPSRYLAGIECDGATYHSAKSARDRDRLRQERLEKLGWNIYRIWSVDWFSDPDREMRKLLRYLTALQKRKSR